MDREKVINGLECHRIDNNHRINCADCPYYVDDDNHIRCVNDLHDDALALLKDQQNVISGLKVVNDGLCKAVTEQKQIVRCKECRHCTFSDGEQLADCMIKQGWFPVKPDWFCADGERKT